MYKNISHFTIKYILFNLELNNNKKMQILLVKYKNRDIKN